MGNDFTITKKDVTVQSATLNGRSCVLRCFETLEHLSIYQTLSKIACDSLPEIIRIEETENGFKVWEEYIDGLTLGELLSEKGTFTEKEILPIAKQLCVAVDIIHGVKIIHRDIKPDNIMITGSGRIVLIDFDAARLYTDEEKSKDTRLLGTEGYAAPEQYGFSQTDFRTDIYGLGATLYELRTGTTPDGRSDYHGKFKKVIEKSISFNPDDRYTDGNSFYSSLLLSLYKKFICGGVIALIFIVSMLLKPFVLQINLQPEDKGTLPVDWSANMTERVYDGEPITVWDILPQRIALYEIPLNIDGFKLLINDKVLGTPISDALGSEKEIVLNRYVDSASYFSYDTTNGIYFAEGPLFAWEITEGGTVHFAYIRMTDGPERSRIWEYTNEPAQECGEEMKNWLILAEKDIEDTQYLFEEMSKIARE